MKIDLTELSAPASFSLQPDLPGSTGSTPSVPDALVSLGPWLEYVDLAVQGLLLWQQQNEDDRLNMAEMLLSQDALESARIQQSGMPAWSRHPVLVPWLDGLQVPPVEGRLAEIVERFGLTLFETQVLILGILQWFDARYALLTAYLQSEEKGKWPGIDLVLTLFSTNLAERMANRLALSSRSGGLFRGELVSVVDHNGRDSDESDAVYLRPDPIVFHFLNGEPADTWRGGLGAAARWHVPAQGASLREGGWAPYADQLAHACFAPHTRTEPARLILLQGGQGRTTLLGQLASEAGRPMLELDLSLLPSDEPVAWRLLRAALRRVRLYAGIILLRGWSEGVENCRALLGALEPYLLEHAQPVVCLVSPEEAGNVWPGMSRLSIVLPPRAMEDDQALLQTGLSSDVETHDWDWTRLLRRTRIDPDGLKQTLSEAHGYRRLRAPDTPLSEGDVQQALRIRGQQQFGALAQRIHPRRTFDDLIVSDSLTRNLQEILTAIRQREDVLARGFSRKVGYGLGISALFYGPSGTGKTMAAEVLAGELGLDLIRIDLSTVVNKYVGETEKNLAKIFDLAVADTGVLLFDEADALFGKRSEVKEAHDRHANIQVSYLLQRLEQYPGLVVLTTNNRGHLDEAFTRRLTFMTRFDAPSVALRERMWRTIWPSQIGVSDDVNWAQWAAATDLTGAGIRNVALLASWLAAEEQRVVMQEDIERAVRLELDKTGRLMLPLSSAPRKG